jgi:uncharacterized membrane-anchored protein
MRPIHLITKTLAVATAFSSLPAFAVGDAPTGMGAVVLLAGLVVFGIACVIGTVYMSLKIAGKSQRNRWLLYGGVPTAICLVVGLWLIGLAISFGVAYWLKKSSKTEP